MCFLAKKSWCQISGHFSTSIIFMMQTVASFNCLDGTRPCFDHTHGITVSCEPCQNVSFSLTTAGLFLVLLWCIFDIIQWIKRRVALHLNCTHATTKLWTMIIFHITTAILYEWWSTQQTKICYRDLSCISQSNKTESYHLCSASGWSFHWE